MVMSKRKPIFPPSPLERAKAAADWQKHLAEAEKDMDPRNERFNK